MQDLTLIGVHEDGLRLLLADAEGNRYTVPLDDSLRAAARRDRPRLGQPQSELAGGLRPAAVQSMIRAGLSAEEVAERAGWPVEKVHRYEGPVLAEREHVVGLARQVRLRSRGASHGPAATLESRIGERLRSREIDPAAVSWDSRRADRGDWVVSLTFAAGGRQREAAWSFDPLARTVAALDDESRWLSEDDDTAAPGPMPAPHLGGSGRPSRVYDVEAEGGVAAPSGRGRSTRPGAVPRSGGASTDVTRAGPTEGAADGGDGPVDLVAAMRQRNAQRGRPRRSRGADVPGLEHTPEDALPLDGLALDPRDHETPPAQHPRDDDADSEAPEGADASGRPDSSGRSDTSGRPDASARPDTSAGSDAAARSDLDTGSDGTDQGTDAPSEAADDPPPTSAPGPRAAASPATTPAEGQAARKPPRKQGAGPTPAAATQRPAEPTQPVRQQTSGSRASQPSDADASDDGAELIEEQVAAPAVVRAEPTPQRQAPRKSGRPSVPSWDDIMFGRKDD